MKKKKLIYNKTFKSAFLHLVKKIFKIKIALKDNNNKKTLSTKVPL